MQLSFDLCCYCRFILLLLLFDMISYFEKHDRHCFINSVHALDQEQLQVASHVCETGIPVVEIRSFPHFGFMVNLCPVPPWNIYPEPSVVIFLIMLCIGASVQVTYRARNKGLYVVARNFFLLLLNCSAWPCLAVA